MSDSLTLRFTVPPDDFTRAGEASSATKATLKQLGFPADIIRRVAIVMYEGEIVGELGPKTTTAQELGLYMAGAKRMQKEGEGA